MAELTDETVRALIDAIRSVSAPPVPGRCLTPQDVAERLQVDVSTVYGWLNSGSLGGANIGGVVRRNWQVKESDLEAFVDSRIKRKQPRQRFKRPWPQSRRYPVPGDSRRS